MRLPIALLLGLAAAAGCTKDDEGRDCVDEDAPPETPVYPDDVYHRARVKIAEEVTYDADGAATRDNSATAAFSDMTKAEMKSRVREGLFEDAACQALTGSPSLECRVANCTKADIVDMTAKQVAIEGLGSGPLTLTSTNGGKGFSSDSVAEPLFEGGELKAVVTGATEAGAFPSYEQTLAAPDPLVLEQPAAGQTRPLGSGEIAVRWKPGNGDFMLLEIRDADPKVTDKVQCFLRDDGCHTVLPEALEWLGIKQGKPFKIVLARVREAIKSIDSESVADLKAISQVEAQYVR